MPDSTCIDYNGFPELFGEHTQIIEHEWVDIPKWDGILLENAETLCSLKVPPWGCVWVIEDFAENVPTEIRVVEYGEAPNPHGHSETACLLRLNPGDLRDGVLGLMRRVPRIARRNIELVDLLSASERFKALNWKTDEELDKGENEE